MTENVLAGDFLATRHTPARGFSLATVIFPGRGPELENELQRDFDLSIWSEQFENIKQEIEDKIVHHPEISAARARITQAMQSVTTKLAKISWTLRMASRSSKCMMP